MTGTGSDRGCTPSTGGSQVTPATTSASPINRHPTSYKSYTRQSALQVFPPPSHQTYVRILQRHHPTTNPRLTLSRPTQATSCIHPLSPQHRYVVQQTFHTTATDLPQRVLHTLLSLDLWYSTGQYFRASIGTSASGHRGQYQPN